jgi:hypothetical protein
MGAKSCAKLSNPVLRVFSKYILAVTADKSDQKIQIMEGFTSISDSQRRSGHYTVMHCDYSD